MIFVNGRLRVHGSAAARGSLVVRDGIAHGRPGGRPVRLRLGRALDPRALIAAQASTPIVPVARLTRLREQAGTGHTEAGVASGLRPVPGSRW